MFEYKVIPAPARTEKLRGLKTTAERFAYVLTQAINAEADEGWEYVRAETLPCEEKVGLMRRVQRSTETVLIFRRPVEFEDEEEEPVTVETPRAAPGAKPTAQRLEPTPVRREPVFRADAISRDAASRRAEPRLRAQDAER
jgi:hypothetical protein